MNVLITSASRKVSLIKAFQQALSSEGGGEVIAVDANPYSAALRFADKRYLTPYLIPFKIDDNFLDIVIDICKRNDVKIVIPTRDEELLYFSSKKDYFKDLGITVMVSDPDTIKICQDKKLFNQFCQKNNFFIPETYENSDIYTISEFPLFIRERFGKGSKFAFPVNSKDELNYFIKKMKDPILQKFIEDPEYTIDLFADFSGNIISAVPRKRIYVFGGESFIGITCKNDVLINEAIRLGKKLKLIGHTTIQCFFNEKTVKFIEVNPRYGGGASLGFAAGAFTPQYLIRLVSGKKVSPVIGKFKNNYMMLRYTDDIFIDEMEVLQLPPVLTGGS